jgi:hypothetical protein
MVSHTALVQHQIEIGYVHLGKALVAQDTGVVDQDMHPAPGFLGLGNHFDHLLIFGHAAAVRHCFAARCLDFLDDLKRRIAMPGAITRAAKVIDHNLRAAPREFECIGFTQSTTCTCHNRDFVFKADGHQISP